MKNNKGITCKVNTYHVTAIAVVDGQPAQLTFGTNERNAREARKFAAEKFGVKPSKVLVNFELEKRAFTIDCDYDTLMNVLGASDITVTFPNDSEDSEDSE